MKRIFSGIAQKSKHDQIPYTTLSYSTGGPNNIAYRVDKDGQAVRIDPSESNTSDFSYSQQATIISDEAYHGGGDVAVYAIGTSCLNRERYPNWISGIEHGTLQLDDFARLEYSLLAPLRFHQSEI